MSSLNSGLWHCFRGRPGFASLKTAVWVLLAPAVATTQDSQGFFVPDLDTDVLLMAEVVEVPAQVTFASPIGIGSIGDLQLALPGQDLADLDSVTVMPNSGEGGMKQNASEGGPQSAAALTVKAAPGRSITILVDKVVSGDGISLADFRCNYNAGSDMACDGSGYMETSVDSGTLLVGVTVTGIDTAVVGVTDGSFDVTISYQ